MRHLNFLETQHIGGGVDSYFQTVLGNTVISAAFCAGVAAFVTSFGSNGGQPLLWAAGHAMSGAAFGATIGFVGTGAYIAYDYCFHSN